jgi:peptidoglycan/xylan/chitin deacetylase (PgdA/CDA1 family)
VSNRNNVQSVLSKKIEAKAKAEAEAKQKVKSNRNKAQIIRKFSGSNIVYNDKIIPTLMYHSIADGQVANSAVVPVAVFKQQMQYLKDNGYTTLSLDELYNFIQNNKPVPKKSLLLTFDDGYGDNYTNAFPILKALGFRATVFVISALTDKPGPYLNSKQLKEMDKNGMSIESHTVNHEKLGELSAEKQLETLTKSKQMLEKTLNKKVKYIAYPFGSYNSNTVEEAKKAGYTMAFTTNDGWAGKNTDILLLNRVFVNSLKGMDQYIERLNNPNYK